MATELIGRWNGFDVIQNGWRFWLQSRDGRREELAVDTRKRKIVLDEMEFRQGLNIIEVIKRVVPA